MQTVVDSLWSSAVRGSRQGDAARRDGCAVPQLRQWPGVHAFDGRHHACDRCLSGSTLQSNGRNWHGVFEVIPHEDATCVYMWLDLIQVDHRKCQPLSDQVGRGAYRFSPELWLE